MYTFVTENQYEKSTLSLIPSSYHRFCGLAHRQAKHYANTIYKPVKEDKVCSKLSKLWYCDIFHYCTLVQFFWKLCGFCKECVKGTENSLL